MKWINKKRNKKGFTLVELVVVIAILGILAAIAVPKFSESRTNAAIKAHNANVRTLESSATLFISEGNMDAEWTGADNEEWSTYLQDWPKLPIGLKEQSAETVTRGANDGDDDTIEVKKLEGNEQYQVDIVNGEIRVYPGRIAD